MTIPTTRTTPPAALPRSGRDRAALPNDPGLDALLADPAIGSTAKTIALALVKHWAWYKDHCWPGDETIAKKIGKSPGHVQRCLRQLELAGWIRREHTSAVPSGRRIWLLWRRPDTGQGARPSSAPARTGESAPARSEQVVVEQVGAEPEEIRCAPQRQRPEPLATVIPPPMVEIPDQATETTGRVAQLNPPTAPTSERTNSPALAPPPADSPPVAPPQGPVMASRHQVTDRPTGMRVPRLVSQRALARTTTAPSLSSTPAITPNHGPPPVVLAAQEQARLRELPEPAREQVLRWLATGDRICVGEARKLLAPPPPPEPPPWSLSTAELLSGLPGRPDRVAAVAGRLATELGDVRSFNFYRSVAESVCSRQQPVEGLVSAWRQAIGPKAVRPGAVFATAWKREIGVTSPG
jgi:hypothetical protein